MKQQLRKVPSVGLPKFNNKKQHCILTYTVHAGFLEARANEFHYHLIACNIQTPVALLSVEVNTKLYKFHRG